MSELEVHKVTSGSPFEARAGYSRAVAVGDWVFVSNTAGIDYATRELPPDARGQALACFVTIEAALAAVGSSLADVVSTRVFVPDAANWDAVIDVLGEKFRGIDPTSTFTAAPLAGPYLVEIEVTAYRGAGAARVNRVSLRP